MAAVELMDAEEKEKEAEVVKASPPLGKLVLEIDMTGMTISDMQAIDRMGAPDPGAFASAVDVMAKFVTNMDIRQRPLRELKAIAKTIMAQIKEEANPGN